ncbi:macrolide transporter subunit MacA [Stieleria neptunia]|uniref:Macrolide transporter subunit MacA n=1 Tax=Stieleria neptunia TaxID=2527979 RepID=A0A518I4C4_9BACT|nr:efflux RND transporter periplasmic adaptor subunit [Stieleria neptunia]QDV47907.1 macrolide transporter subunit MacA [Stieleria neptunia]
MMSLDSPPARRTSSPEPVDGDATGSSLATATKPTRQKRWMLRIILLLSFLGILIGGTVVLPGLPLAPVDGPHLTHTVSRSDLVVSVTEQGTLESSNNTEIKCQIRGFSTIIWVVEGGTVVQPGDELVRLDTKRIEDAIGKHTTDAHMARATYERTKADVAKAEIAIDAYLEGSYKTQRQGLQQQLKIAQSNLETAQKMLGHSEDMFRRGYVSELEVEGNRFTVKQAELELGVRETAVMVLDKYTKEMQLETLQGQLRAQKSKLLADEAGLAMDEGRRDRAIRELDECVITAGRTGLVIYPPSEQWKETPDIAEGKTVRKDQVLLLMPDLMQMQVKVAIHESLIDRIEKGLSATVSLPELTVEGSVKSVATVAAPAGWWTGNVVKYDTIVDLPSVAGLKPGMTAEVEVIMATHQDVLTVPVSAVVETEDESLCWVRTPTGFQRRVVMLGDSNEVFIIVRSGLNEGDEVVLNPLQFVDEAEGEARQRFDDREPGEDRMSVQGDPHV